MLSEHIVNQIAHAAYAAVTAWDEANGAEAAPSWVETDDQTRANVSNRVRMTLTDPRAGDASFHNARLAQAKIAGWTHGREYDETLKTDPSLVPFHLLPPEDQSRERVFRAIALSLSRI